MPPESCSLSHVSAKFQAPPLPTPMSSSNLRPEHHTAASTALSHTLLCSGTHLLAERLLGCLCRLHVTQG